MFYTPNPIVATHSLLLHILLALLSPLFTSKELDVHLVQEKGVVTPGTGRLQDIFDRLLLQLQKEFWSTFKSDKDLIFEVYICEEEIFQILPEWILVEARRLRGYIRTSGSAAIIYRVIRLPLRYVYISHTFRFNFRF